jgi:hypothetical protein
MHGYRTSVGLLTALLLLSCAAACDKKGESDALPAAGLTSAAPSPAPTPTPAPLAAPAGRVAPVKYVPRAGGFPESEACKSCVAEAGFSQFDCNNETGNAKAGPAAGTSRKQLCVELLDCLYSTKCAAQDPVDCYCGTSGEACAQGGGNGSCREQIERSLESTTYGEIALHFADPKLAGGTAMTRMDGARAKCGQLCGSR